MALVPVTYNIETGSYRMFIANLRRELANHLDDVDRREVYPGRPLLPKVVHQDQGPARWININLVAGNNVRTTLAIRDDTVYLVGFKNQNEEWYEFGFEEGSARLLPQDHRSTFLECDFTYKGLLDHGPDPRKPIISKDDVKLALTSLELGKSFAREAVLRLSGFAPPAGPKRPPDAQTRRDLVRLCIMICESARMCSHHDTVENGWGNGEIRRISERQVYYMWNWGLMSRALIWRSVQGQNYRWPPKLITEARIHNEADALPVVKLLRNNQPQPQGQPPQRETIHVATSDDSGGGGAAIARHVFGKWVLPLLHQKGATTSPHQMYTSSRAIHGLPLLEVFALSVGFDFVGQIAVFDGMRGQIIYKNERRRNSTAADATLRDDMGNVVLTGPYRAISASESFCIKVDIPTAQNEPSDGGKLYWDYRYDAIDIPCTRTIRTRHSTMDVTYAVLSNAVEASVQLILMLPPGVSPAHIHVHGKVTARMHSVDKESVLFSRNSGDKVALTSNSHIPLARSVVAAQLGYPLLVEVDLFASYERMGLDINDRIYNQFELHPSDSGLQELSYPIFHSVHGWTLLQTKVQWSLDDF